MKNIVALLLLSSAAAETSDFKNEQEFEKARNDLNNAEGKNKDMFDTINDKLQDSDLVMMASQNDDMSDAMATCYIDRYPDLVSFLA